MCPLCKVHQDTQEHALTCEVIALKLALNVKKMICEVKYEDIFGDLENQQKIAAVYQEIIRIRKRLLA